ncbi:hypothetical protein TNCV_3670461 [Trichonephila clavipes]|nr:hypothetical protein TNCV_3670461 [Trichonephila clavipes]
MSASSFSVIPKPLAHADIQGEGHPKTICLEIILQDTSESQEQVEEQLTAYVVMRVGRCSHPVQMLMLCEDIV